MRNWEIQSKTKKVSEKLTTKKIVEVLLKNRGLKTKKEQGEFLKPKSPEGFTLKEVGIKKEAVQKAIKRIKKAVKGKENVIVYGDYDADGVCATAILWETLHSLGVDTLPYIPERFSEGYGLNAESIKKIKSENENLGLIITVDNGIVANGAIEVANSLGVDVVITDHHTKGKKLPKAHAIIHTTKIGGAGISWIFAREIRKALHGKEPKAGDGIELAAIGTVSDQIPLLGPNRSFVKYGIEALSKTKRPGLSALFEEAVIERTSVGTYHINFLIAPRLNAMGRMQHAIDSLRLLCTTDKKRAGDLAKLLGKTNAERQRVVEKVVIHAREVVASNKSTGVIVVAHESYHEGVVGLAASKLVEEFYRPAIVFSKGAEVSKASARSVSGFNIIEAIRKVEDMLLGAGGHPMAAGLSLETKRLDEFTKRLNEEVGGLLTEDILTRSLKVDMEIELDQINEELMEELKKFEPTGIGNPRPTFLTKGVEVLEARAVGKTSDHLKLRLAKEPSVFGGIAFNRGSMAGSLQEKISVDVVYGIEENVWNGKSDIELRIKDIVPS